MGPLRRETTVRGLTKYPTLWAGSPHSRGSPPMLCRYPGTSISFSPLLFPSDTSAADLQSFLFHCPHCVHPTRASIFFFVRLGCFQPPHTPRRFPLRPAAACCYTGMGRVLPIILHTLIHARYQMGVLGILLTGSVLACPCRSCLSLCHTELPVRYSKSSGDAAAAAAPE